MTLMYSFFTGSPSKIETLNPSGGKRYLVMNRYNKCMSYSEDLQMTQSMCNFTDMRQHWKWKGSSLKNAIMDLLVSLTQTGTGWDPEKREQFPIFKVSLRRSIIGDQWIHQSWSLNAIGQLVSITSNRACLGIESHSDSHGAALSARMKKDSCGLL